MGNIWVGRWLSQMISEVFFNLNASIILCIVLFIYLFCYCFFFPSNVVKRVSSIIFLCSVQMEVSSDMVKSVLGVFVDLLALKPVR